MPIVGSFPVTLLNGTTGDATQVMAILNFIAAQVNANALALGVPSKGALIGPPQLITTTIVYNPSPVPGSILAILIGDGGAGGGAAITGVGVVSTGTGGGGGAVTIDYYTSGFVGQTITVGTGGLGVAGGVGGSGTGTSFMGVTAGGGVGGTRQGPAAPNYIEPGPRGGIPVSSTLYFNYGDDGGMALCVAPGSGLGGYGGASGLGGGWRQGAGPLSGSGNNNPAFGGGGSGALNLPSQGAALPGGNGGPGCAIIFPFSS